MKGACIGLLVLCAFPITAQNSDVPEANPVRPTVSTPATLSPVGYLQLETGSLGATTSPEFSTRIGINQVTRFAVTRRFDVFSVTEPYVHAAIGTAKIGPGEVFLRAQAVLVAGQSTSPTISVSYIRRLYRARSRNSTSAHSDKAGYCWQAMISRFSLRWELNRDGANRARSPASAERPDAVDFPPPTKINDLWRVLDIFATVSCQPCHRHPVVSILSPAPQFSHRHRLRPRSYRNIHSLGRLRRIHIRLAGIEVGHDSAGPTYDRWLLRSRSDKYWLSTVMTMPFAPMFCTRRSFVHQ